MSHKPDIIVYSGPMFAGKSTSLINKYINSTTPKAQKVVFKFSQDTRYSIDPEIVTHSNMHIPCIMINTCADITNYLSETLNCNITEIYIDECQFLPDIYTWITNMKNKNTSVRNIILAGLDLDATGKPFTDAFNKVINEADINYSLFAKCYVCNENAGYTKLLNSDSINKMSGDTNNVLIGGADLYQPVCVKHFS